MKHAVHGCDAGRVETERLVERRRALPSQKRACDERRGAGQEAGEQCGGGGASSVQERTWNVKLMSVTLEVSRLSGWLNADALYRVGRRAYDAGRGAGREA